MTSSQRSTSSSGDAYRWLTPDRPFFVEGLATRALLLRCARPQAGPDEIASELSAFVPPGVALRHVRERDASLGDGDAVRLGQWLIVREVLDDLARAATESAEREGRVEALVLEQLASEFGGEVA